jgi:hypothetical protein
MERLAEGSSVPVVEEGSDPSEKLLKHLAVAAVQMNVDIGDKDAVDAFLDQIKALVTSDKTALLAKLRKSAGKDPKALAKKALAEKD